MSNVIECKNLTHFFGRKKVFENLNFDVQEGRILGLLGKNGTGKTTTINILNGFLQPTKGECLIFGEDVQHLSPSAKARIGFLIEGHIQYSFMTIRQIEKFYSGFYPNWKPGPFWELMSKLNISWSQKISTMSCGQRSQVALGLVLAQDPDLLILDDFSMGLDPGYRRLFVDYLREYAKAESKTVFTTSHIIQDMERLIDDLLIIDSEKVLAQDSVANFLTSFKRFDFELEGEYPALSDAPLVVNLERVKNKVELYTYADKYAVTVFFADNGIAVRNLKEVEMDLEDAFVGITGKY